MDGNGDGRAEADNDEDVLYTFGKYLTTYGNDLANIRIGLWEFYERDQSVGIITGFIKLFRKYGHIDLGAHAFPLPIRSDYSYRSTWGDARASGAGASTKEPTCLPITEFRFGRHATESSK